MGYNINKLELSDLWVEYPELKSYLMGLIESDDYIKGLWSETLDDYSDKSDFSIKTYMKWVFYKVKISKVTVTYIFTNYLNDIIFLLKNWLNVYCNNYRNIEVDYLYMAYSAQNLCLNAYMDLDLKYNDSYIKNYNVVIEDDYSVIFTDKNSDKKKIYSSNMPLKVMLYDIICSGMKGLDTLAENYFDSE